MRASPSAGWHASSPAAARRSATHGRHRRRRARARRGRTRARPPRRRRTGSCARRRSWRQVDRVVTHTCAAAVASGLAKSAAQSRRDGPQLALDGMTTPRTPAARRRLSLFGSIRPYQRAWLSRDVLAGVTLAALAIPEVLGYTKIAGTPVITGLYTMLLPVLAFAAFGSSRHLVVGGDSATAAIMFAGIGSLGDRGAAAVHRSKWLALASLSALLAAGMLLDRAAGAPRVPRGFHLENGARRLSDRGRDRGRDGPTAGHARRARSGRRPRSRRAAPSSGSGTRCRRSDEASGATLAVSLGVLATIVVFGRWILRDPGRARRGGRSDRLSGIFDFSAHGVSGPRARTERAAPHRLA